MSDLSDKAEQLGHQAHNSDWLDRAIRVGMVAYGIVHLTIAWLALQLAFGHNTNASSTGAMHQLARQPWGEPLLWVIAVGMLFLVLWRWLEAALGHRAEEGFTKVRKRLVSFGKGVIYGAVGVSALRVALHASSKSKGPSMTAKLLNMPMGRLIVGAIGLAVIAYGANYAWRGWKEKFMEHLDAEGSTGDDSKAYRMFGKVGYISKGLAFIIIGGLFAGAAVTHDAKTSGGLDQALGTIRQQTFGPILLTVVAVGIACYGLFCFARARHLSR